MNNGTSADELRFRSLYTQHVDALLSFALRRVDSPEEAADVVADTFLVAWRRLHDVPPADEARLWLYGVGRRMLANHSRSFRRRDRLGGRLRWALGRAVSVPDPADDVAVITDVRAALDRLSRDDRELLRLVGWEGLEPHEVALVLGLPASTVRTRLSRARSRLRAALGNAQPWPGHVLSSSNARRREEDS